MAFTTISNGDVPDATVVMANFNYILALVMGGGGIKTDTYAALRIYAALTPAVPFMCIATDNDLFLLYCGNVLRGDGGFITLASFGEIS